MSNIADKYLGHADHAVGDLQKTLEAIGLTTATSAAYTGTLGNNQTAKAIEEVMDSNGTKGLTLKIKGGSAALGAVINVVNAGKDTNGKEWYQAAVEGAGTTFIADSIASATAKALVGVGATSTGLLVGAEVAVSVHTNTIIKESKAYFIEGMPNILGGTRWSSEQMDGYQVLASGWSLQDMLDENMYETIFIHGEKNLKNVYEEGKSFHLKAIENHETYFSYDSLKNIAHYAGTLAQANTLSGATANGQSDIDAVASFLDKGEFQLETKSGDMYTIYSIANLSVQELVNLAREHEAVFDTLMTLKSGNCIIDEYPVSMGHMLGENVQQYSDEYLGERAKFLKQKVLQEEESLESLKTYTYIDNETNTRSYGSGSGNIMTGDSPTYFGGHEGKMLHSWSTHLFGSQQGNQTADSIEGSLRKDYVEGLDGSDTIRTYDGDDIIYTNAKGLSPANDTEDSTITNRVYAGAGNDKVYGSNGIDIVYGGEGEDIIEGRGGDDILYGGKEKGKESSLFRGGDYDILRGGTGNDELHGGRGGDRLEGGKDFDTYYAVDKNVIEDSDGLGTIHFKGKTLGIEEMAKITDGHYVDGTFSYKLDENANLIVQDMRSKETITIEDFHSGDLGIELEKNEVEECDDFVILDNNSVKIKGDYVHDKNTEILEKSKSLSHENNNMDDGRDL